VTAMVGVAVGSSTAGVISSIKASLTLADLLRLIKYQTAIEAIAAVIIKTAIIGR